MLHTPYPASCVYHVFRTKKNTARSTSQMFLLFRQYMRLVCKISSMLETTLCFSCLPRVIISYANGTGSWSHLIIVSLCSRLSHLSSLSMEGTSRWYKNRILGPRIHHTTRSQCSASIHYHPPLQHGRPSLRKPTSMGFLSYRRK